MADEFEELRQAIKEAVPRRTLASISEVGDKIEVVFKTGGREMDAQEERKVKMLVYRVLSKEGVVKHS
ncbi:MAG: hypothetical protein A3G93_01965 [Nitrospinae bacterium RIFCSPLOWO2_12_FULL_45_22]|nr:MAG: hypothetical protein A3G93_01965 [Nitrospinae bacterium RIFCSPLOWO2_12_FULL_45_22]